MPAKWGPNWYGQGWDHRYEGPSAPGLTVALTPPCAGNRLDQTWAAFFDIADPRVITNGLLDHLVG